MHRPRVCLRRLKANSRPCSRCDQKFEADRKHVPQALRTAGKHQRGSKHCHRRSLARADQPHAFCLFHVVGATPAVCSAASTLALIRNSSRCCRDRKDALKIDQLGSMCTPSRWAMKVARSTAGTSPRCCRAQGEPPLPSCLLLATLDPPLYWVEACRKRTALNGHFETRTVIGGVGGELDSHEDVRTLTCESARR